jgi:hypothetical protein
METFPEKEIAIYFLLEDFPDQEIVLNHLTESVRIKEN